MIYAEAGTNRLVLSASESATAESYEGWHALAPVAVGSALPFSAALLLAPTFFANAIPFITVLLTAHLLGVVAIAIYSILRKGDVIAVSLDPRTRNVEIIYNGLFANSTVRIPTASITTVEMAVADDDDGCGRQYPQLVTERGERIALPANLTASDLSAFRKALARSGQ